MGRREGVPGRAARGASGPEVARGVGVTVSLPEAARDAGVTGPRAAVFGRDGERHGR
ncbi:hypothetical protein [Microtetraspora malaysiensis]|uniref:Uncharacterized protein n=1 Tax=Microtetraspora malaysiensis TaxID=161358 RepID=A0ABW6SIB6_9ACTN